MNDIILLDDLYPLQKELDEEIASLHQVSYESTHARRLLALLVEFGEFANETRCFKYWSLKGPGPKERILDEYADGLHFFLSLGIPLGVTSFRRELTKKDVDPTIAILEVYEKAARLLRHFLDYISIEPIILLAIALKACATLVFEGYLRKRA